jgi:hypothetical protein
MAIPRGARNFIDFVSAAQTRYLSAVDAGLCICGFTAAVTLISVLSSLEHRASQLARVRKR